ncbi:MAG TPA: alpha-ketoglutarate-dependent dioxygenase AlkB [Acidimicrobiales bacterium]
MSTTTGHAALRPLETERTHLDERSWVDVCRGWVQQPDEVTRALLEHTSWTQGRVYRYDRWIDEPRLGAGWKPGRPVAHPVLVEAHRVLQQHYGVRFDGFALALYRDGRDSVAFHRDREMRWLEDTVIAVLTFGAKRPWLLRPRSSRYDHEAPNRGAAFDFAPASGDLLVMGGRAQADWEHAVPKVPMLREPRVSIQWRWTSRRGRPEVGANYGAPRPYSR